MSCTPFSRFLWHKGGRYWAARANRRDSKLWCCHRPTVAMEMLVLMLMLMLVKMLVMVLMRLVMHELRRAHPRGNPVRCLRLQETVVKFVTEKFRTRRWSVIS